jgi:7-cyano-7-deazaguanine synthase in queuosine biosynthesis
MQISNLTTTRSDGSARISATVDAQKYHGRVWFEFSNGVDFASDASAFVALSLMPAMRISEDIDVADSTISTRLYENVKVIQNVLLEWKCGFSPVAVRSRMSDDVFKTGELVGVFFSGGVDSFYTLLKNAADADERISHLILVNGFDVDYTDTETFEVIQESVLDIAKDFGVRVLVVKTNLREFTDPLLEWGFAHGGALAAVALLLRPMFHTVYIPSSYDYDTLHPWGSHPDIDPLWSTERQKIIHHGTAVSRVHKTTEVIAKSPLALQHVRVCWKNVRGRYNCGSCPKCIRTMIDLRIAGVLDNSRAFDEPLTMQKIRDADARGFGSRIFYEQSLQELQLRKTDEELEAALIYLLAKRGSGPLTLLRDTIGRFDSRYNKGRLYKFLSTRGLV